MNYPLVTLYVPGTRPELIEKAGRVSPDAVIIDLGPFRQVIDRRFPGGNRLRGPREGIFPGGRPVHYQTGQTMIKGELTRPSPVLLEDIRTTHDENSRNWIIGTRPRWGPVVGPYRLALMSHVCDLQRWVEMETRFFVGPRTVKAYLFLDLGDFAGETPDGVVGLCLEESLAGILVGSR